MAVSNEPAVAKTLPARDCARSARHSGTLEYAFDLAESTPLGKPEMITVGMNYHVLPGKQKEFEEKFQAVIGALKAAAGHTTSTLWKDVSDDASYLITSEWSEEQAFLDFIHS